MLLASGTARLMTERPDEHRLLAQYLAEVRQKPLLTPAQELALGEQKNAGAKARQQVTSGRFVTREEGMALAEHMRSGDQAHTALVEGNVRYVVTIAKKYAAAGLAQGFSLLDVIQEGNVGLTRAIEKFDVHRGFRVTTHVTWWIRQAITHALAKHSGTIHIPEHMQKHVRRLALLQDKAKGARLYVSELTWIFFLRYLDLIDEKAEAEVKALKVDFELTIEAPYRWRDWAATYDRRKDPKEIIKNKERGWKRCEIDNGTGNYIEFVNKELFPYLKGLKDLPSATNKQKIVSLVIINKAIFD